MVLEDAMYGWTEIPSDPEFELSLTDPAATDDANVTMLELGAGPDAAIRWSYIYDDGIGVMQHLTPGVDNLQYTGWMFLA